MRDAKDATALYNKDGVSRVVYTEAEDTKARADGFTEPYRFTEYPKSMHKDGDRTAPERVVKDAGEERAARADGFKMIDKKADEKSAAALTEVEETQAEQPAPKKGKK